MTAPLFGWVLVGLAAGYASAIVAGSVGLRRVLRARPAPLPADPPFVSVIVPARDEAAVIGRCLTSVLACTYPPDRFEVIVVDDLSEDSTADVVRRVAVRAREAEPALVADGGEADEPTPERVRLLQMPENLDRTRAHKKRAIEKGVAEAHGAIILTTDADCVVPPGWIAAMAAEFGDITAEPDGQPVTAFVSGPVLYAVERPALLRMQALEFFGLVALGAGCIGLGRPMTCNGANVAYRKDVFAALGGFSGIDHLTSGDDELLMQKVARETPHAVRFCGVREATVETAPVRTLGGFLQQRRRWASKGVHYPSPALVGALVAVWAYHAALTTGSLAAPFVAGLGAPVLIALGLNLVAHAALAVPAARHFGRTGLLPYLLPTEALRVPYFAWVGLAGALGRFEWKGRRVER